MGSLNVLIADDNRDAAESLGILLRLAGHEVRVVHDGAEAVAAFEESPAEVAILDIAMPGVDGYSVARHLRRVSPGGTPILVAVTGWGQENDKARAIAAGFNHHFTRPVEPEKLTDLLRSPVPAMNPPTPQPPEPAAKHPLNLQLLNELCHDLRGPLGALGTWIQVLRAERTDDETRLRALAAITGDVRAMGALIDQLSALTLALSGPAKLALGPIDMVPFLESVWASVAENGSVPPFRADEVSLVAIADPVGLRQIAELFASASFDTVPVGSRALCLARRGQAAEFTVETAGTPGVLSVTLARTLTEAQGGVFEESLEGGTTSLRVLLPLAR